MTLQAGGCSRTLGPDAGTVKRTTAAVSPGELCARSMRRWWSGRPRLWAGRNLYSLPPKPRAPRSAPAKTGRALMRAIVCSLAIGLIPGVAAAQSQPKPDWAFPVPDKVKVEPRFAPDRVRTVNGLSYTRAAVDDFYNVPV